MQVSQNLVKTVCEGGSTDVGEQLKKEEDNNTVCVVQRRESKQVKPARRTHLLVPKERSSNGQIRLSNGLLPSALFEQADPVLKGDRSFFVECKPVCGLIVDHAVPVRPTHKKAVRRCTETERDAQKKLEGGTHRK